MNYIKITQETPLNTGDVIIGKEPIHFEIRGFDLIKQQVKVHVKKSGSGLKADNEYVVLHCNSLFSGEWKKLLVD